MSALVPSAKALRQGLLRSRCVPQPDLQRGAGRGPEPEGVELLARREIPTSSARPRASAPAAVARWSRCAAVSGRPPVAQQLLHEVGLQPLLEQREPGPCADVGAEGDPYAVLDVLAQREQPAAEGGVARRAVRDAGAALGKERELAGGRMDVVCVDASAADQPVPGVAREVVVALIEQVADRGHLRGFSLMWEVNNEPGTSSCSAAQEASMSSVQESEKRGITAYRLRPTPCQRSASARPSSYPFWAEVSRSGRRLRSLTTSPLVIRSPAWRPARRGHPPRVRSGRRRPEP